jgi:predicted metalloenzyme YecM
MPRICEPLFSYAVFKWNLEHRCAGHSKLRYYTVTSHNYPRIHWEQYGEVLCSKCIYIHIYVMRLYLRISSPEAAGSLGAMNVVT